MPEIFGVQPTTSRNGVLVANYHNPVDASGGARVMTLPTAVDDFTILTVEKTDASSNTVTVSGNVRGAATVLTLTLQHEVMQFASRSSDESWWPIADHKPLATLDSRYSAMFTPPKVQVTDSCYAMPVTATAVTVATEEFYLNVGIAACDLQLVFVNYTSPTATPVIDIDPATTLTFGAALRDAAGNVYNVTFNGGQKQATLAGGGMILTDPLPIEVAQGDLIFVRTFLASGTHYVTRASINVANGGGRTITTDLTATGSAAVTQAGVNGYGPSAVIGTPISTKGTPRAVIVQGDSIGNGAQDGQLPLFAGYYKTKPWIAGGGFLHRALTGQAGVIQAAQSGDEMQWFLANNGHFRRGAFTRFCRYAIIQYGINDLGSGGRTPAQLQQDLLTQATRNLARGIVKNIVCTLPPSTTSTDRFVTTVNQTPAATNAGRIAHNTWVRDSGPIDPVTLAPVAAGTANALRFGAAGHPIGGYVEAADPVESARNSGVWAAAQRVVSDGSGAVGTFEVDSATAAFTAADIGRDVCLVGAGAAGADFYTQIDSIITGTRAATRLAPSTAVAGAQLIIAPMTSDGLHPLTSANQIMAAAIQTQLLALTS